MGDGRRSTDDSSPRECERPAHNLTFSGPEGRVNTAVERVLRQVEAARDEIVQFAAQLVRIPTVNPPGENYRECADTIGRQLVACGFEVELIEATGRPEHTA